MGSDSGHFLGKKKLFAASLVTGAILATGAFAQTDPKIVMRCTYDGYNNQTMDFAVDLDARTISGTHTINMPGAAPAVITFQPNLGPVTNDQITWTYSDSNRSVTDTLNRYTGQIVERIMFQGSNLTNTLSCQRRQRQF